MINYQKSHTSMMINRKRSKHIIKVAYNIYRVLYLFFVRKIVNYQLRSTSSSYVLPTPSAESDQSPRIILSLCSFPKRLDTLWITIETLFRQSVTPDKIILYLSKEQVSRLDDLPQSLLAMQSRGLEISLEEGHDLRSHKKYHYAQRDYPNDIIITVDDDVYYPNNIISSLLDKHREYPTAVIANRAKPITYDENGELLPYNKWLWIDSRGLTQEYRFVQIGVYGVLYPPHVLHTDVLDSELAMQLAPAGDDLWLYAMTRLNGHVVIQSDMREELMSVAIKDDVCLTTQNLGSNYNDTQIENIRKYYIEHMKFDIFGK